MWREEREVTINARCVAPVAWPSPALRSSWFGLRCTSFCVVFSLPNELTSCVHFHLRVTKIASLPSTRRMCSLAQRHG